MNQIQINKTDIPTWQTRAILAIANVVNADASDVLLLNRCLKAEKEKKRWWHEFTFKNYSYLECTEDEDQRLFEMRIFGTGRRYTTKKILDDVLVLLKSEPIDGVLLDEDTVRLINYWTKE